MHICCRANNGAQQRHRESGQNDEKIVRLSISIIIISNLIIIIIIIIFRILITITIIQLLRFA